MTGNQGQAAMMTPETRRNRTATRFACHHGWNRRGDNTKYKAKK